MWEHLKERKRNNMARTLKKVSKQLFKASRLHKGQAQKIANYIKKNEKKKRSKSRNRKKA